MLSPLDILGSEGSIARRLERYEQRSEQLAMSEKVNEAFLAKRHLAVEAGTGVGKSFAYLVPAILQTAEIQTEKPEHSDEDEDPFYGDQPAHSTPPGGTFGGEIVPRAVISTHTISLQEQLIEKDIPFLRSVLPIEFSAVLVKGRSNYLCRRRLRNTLQKRTALIEDRQQRELERLAEWSSKTADGSKSDLNPEPAWDVWNEVCCESGNCLGRACTNYKDCFYAKARRRIANAQLVIVNHAILFSDLAIRMQGGSILPPYSLLVFDEAHTMEQVAADHLGLSVTQGQIEYNLNRLYNDRTEKGLLSGRSDVDKKLTEAAKLGVDEARYRAELFFQDILAWLQKRPGNNGRVREPGIVNNGLTESLRSLTDKLREVIEKTKNPEERQELRSARDRVLVLADGVNTWLRQGLEDESVYWLEEHRSARGISRVTINATPLDVGPILREQLFEKIPSVVMTSATLATSHLAGTPAPPHLAGTPASPTKRAGVPAKKGNDPFSFFKGRIGLTALETLQLGSPFDFEKQATLVIVKGGPSPTDRDEVLRPHYTAMLKRYIAETNGGAFVLFTSYQLLKRLASDLTPWLAERNLPLFVHGSGMPRSEMVRRFKESTDAVLFGTDSFWQGVDVPGNALRNVIITKLPFLVPNQPVVEAKIEAIQTRGGVPFREFQLPQAILKFKQGFGRLIRTRSDTGLVVVLDSRIQTQSYGRQFVESLPKCSIRVDTVSSSDPLAF